MHLSKNWFMIFIESRIFFQTTADSMFLVFDLRNYISCEKQNVHVITSCRFKRKKSKKSIAWPIFLASKVAYENTCILSSSEDWFRCFFESRIFSQTTADSIFVVFSLRKYISFEKENVHVIKSCRFEPKNRKSRQHGSYF